VPGVDDLVHTPDRVHQDDQRAGSRVRRLPLHQRLGHQPPHLHLVTGILSRPPADREHAEDPVPPGVDHPAVGQPPIQRRRKFLLNGPITADGRLPCRAMMISSAASKSASSAGERSRTMIRPGVPGSSSTRFAPPSPASTEATRADSRPLASSVTSSRKSSARSMLTRYSAGTAATIAGKRARTD